MMYAKRVPWVIVLLLLATVGLAFLPLGAAGPTRAAVPPLSLEGYMDERLPEAPANRPQLKADNSACYVCHGNYQEEPLVIAHGKEKVGCIDCHGKSYAHRNDEDNITPPDRMFPAEEIDRMCSECHDMHDAPAKKVIGRWQERCPDKTDPAQLVCTDCHFQHRLARRTVRWNKKTGELIIRNKAESAEPARAVSRDDSAPPRPPGQ